MKGIGVPNSWVNQYKPKSRRYFRKLHRFTEWMHLNPCKPLSRFTWFKIILLLISSLDSFPAQGTCHSAAQDPHYLNWISSPVWQRGAASAPLTWTFAAAEKPFNNGLCKTTKMHRRQQNFIILYMIVFHLDITALRREQRDQSNNSALVNPL